MPVAFLIGAFVIGYLTANAVNVLLFWRCYRPCLQFILVIYRWAISDEETWRAWQEYQLAEWGVVAPADQRELAAWSFFRLNTMGRVYKFDKPGKADA